ncbi:MAG: DMT family transporter [Phototrophicaceae bacterium]
MRRDTLEGLFYVLLSALGYAAMPIWINYLYRYSEIQPLELFILRFGLAIPMMWLGMGLLRQFRPHMIPNESPRRLNLLVVGLFISAASLSAFYALQNISAGIYEVLLYTFPSMVSVLAIFRGEVLPVRGWIALLLASIGIVITSLVADGGAQTGGNPNLGVILSLVNALSVALFLTLTAHAQRGRASNPLATAWAITGTGIVILPLLFVVDLRLNYPLSVWWMLLGLSLLSTTIPLFGVLMGTQKLGASRAAIVNTIEPVFTFIMAAMFLNEFPKGLQILGGIFIIGSIILMEYRTQHKSDIGQG